MLERIHIENFKSLKNITVDLQRVNLLIGTNNSGKSNFLKAIQFMLRGFKTQFAEPKEFHQILFKKKVENGLVIDFYTEAHVYHLLSNSEVGLTETIKSQHKNFELVENSFQFVVDLNKYGNGSIYQPQPENFYNNKELLLVESLDESCSNLIPFLFNLSQNHKKKFAELEQNLEKCVGEFVSIGTPAVQEHQKSWLALKLFDKFDNAYWAREVSEGVLYFLALLCIIHQPNPPKLLLLEEPERGIHPRRIREVLDFIFNLAYEKDIQVIMTTHNERVLNYFEDTPEAVFVFDKDEEGATQIKNLKNIIEESDREMQEKGLPKIPFTESLGEHWVTGFIGGVPKSFY